MAWLFRRRRSRALVLLYHRVTDLTGGVPGMALPPEMFAAQLEVLRRRTRLCRLDHLADALAGDDVPQRSVALTFDDGYADNFEVARPLLERHEAPATFFVATQCLGGQREFWWDALARIVFEPPRLPSELLLDLGRGRVRWSTTSRPHLHRRLHAGLRDCALDVRHEAVARLHAWAGVPEGVRPTHRTLRANEVAALAGNPLFDIGAHTVTHPRLSVLPAEAQFQEMVRSRHALEDIVGGPVRSLAYPYGGRSDTTAVTRDLAREAGFADAWNAACSGVGRAACPHALDRCYAPRLAGAQFERWLERLVGA